MTKMIVNKVRSRIMVQENQRWGDLINSYVRVGVLSLPASV